MTDINKVYNVLQKHCSPIGCQEKGLLTERSDEEQVGMRPGEEGEGR